MGAIELSTNQKYSNKKLIINTTSWMINLIPNLYSAVSDLRQQHETHLQKDCRVNVKPLLYYIKE